MMKLFAIILAVALMFGCTGVAQDAGEKPLIAVASFPIYEHVKEIAGDDFEVWLMQPPGLNAHSYEPTPKELVRLNSADVFVYVGRNFELWAPKAADASLSVNALEIEAGDRIELLEDLSENNGYDPHVWMSIKNSANMAEHIAEKLGQKYPDKKERINLRTKKYVRELDSLDKEYAMALENCERNEIFVSHAAFGYMARDYGVKQVPIVKSFDPSGDEVSIAELKELVDNAKAHGATHVFFEEFVSPKMSEALAREVGAKTSALSPMEAYFSWQITDGKLYIWTMRENLEVIREGLGCD